MHSGGVFIFSNLLSFLSFFWWAMIMMDILKPTLYFRKVSSGFTFSPFVPFLQHYSFSSLCRESEPSTVL